MSSVSNHAVTSDCLFCFLFFHYDYFLSCCVSYIFGNVLLFFCLLVGTITYTNIHNQDIYVYIKREEKRKRRYWVYQHKGKSRIILIMHQFLLLHFLLLPFSLSLSLSLSVVSFTIILLRRRIVAVSSQYFFI